MIFIATILFNVFTSCHINQVDIDFTFKKKQYGKPTLKYYYYDVSLSNTGTELQYVVLPKWFKPELDASGTISGAQYDSFGTAGGATLFTETTCTVFTVPPGKKVSITDFCIETFDEKIESMKSIQIPVIICNKVVVGNFTVEDFIKKNELFNDNLKYEFQNPVLKNLEVKVK